MRLPRDVSGAEVVRALERKGFRTVRQVGSHKRLALNERRVTVPMHRALAPKTLQSILSQAGLSIEDLSLS